MSLALVDEGSVGEGEGDTSAHIECTALLVVEACHRTLYSMRPKVIRILRGCACLEGFSCDIHLSCCISIGHPELVVLSHCRDICVRCLVNCESLWRCAVRIDVYIVLSSSYGFLVKLCNISASVCSNRSNVCCLNSIATDKNDIHCRNSVLFGQTHLSVRSGIRVRITFTFVVSLAPGREHLNGELHVNIPLISSPLIYRRLLAACGNKQSRSQ